MRLFPLKIYFFPDYTMLGSQRITASVFQFLNDSGLVLRSFSLFTKPVSRRLALYFSEEIWQSLLAMHSGEVTQVRSRILLLFQQGEFEVVGMYYRKNRFWSCIFRKGIAPILLCAVFFSLLVFVFVGQSLGGLTQGLDAVADQLEVVQKRLVFHRHSMASEVKHHQSLLKPVSILSDNHATVLSAILESSTWLALVYTEGPVFENLSAWQKQISILQYQVQVQNEQGAQVILYGKN